MKITYSIGIFFTLCGLYISVYYSFYFHQHLLGSAQHFYPFLIIGLFALMIYFTVKIIQTLKMPELQGAIVVLIFVILNFKLLYTISSINRGIEISSYYNKNESRLMELINHYKIVGKDEALDSLVSATDIKSFYFHKGVYRFKLYGFLGYGYKLAYTESPDSLNRRIGFEGSPVRTFYKINSNWCYYSYLD